MSFSQNAIMAKSRALYGKGLKTEDYDAMLNCKRVGDVAVYLKSQTNYHRSFEKANSGIGTPQIEELLRIHILKCYEKIGRYEISTRAQFYKSLLMKNEVEQILRFLHFLVMGKPNEYLEILPPFFNERIEIDLYALAKAESFEDMLNALKGTQYFKVLQPFSLTYKDPQIYLQMELALDEKLWEKEKSIVESFNGKAKQGLTDVLAFQNDMETLTRIYRLKNMSNKPNGEIKRYLNLNFTHFSQKQIDLLLNCENAVDMLQIMSATHYKSYLKKYTFDSLESFTQKILYEKFSKEIRYSTDPITVMVSCFWLVENEAKNITHIVEGIKYGMSPQTIRSLLIGMGG